ncbi:hypothetical protein Z950_2620 [Sulfitobacter mediterraneus KCTC 32188]|nr:hypothetical protein Z950_2620 [Sulfitobacter mediterraneus KCTC 32188]
MITVAGCGRAYVCGTRGAAVGFDPYRIDHADATGKQPDL